VLKLLHAIILAPDGRQALKQLRAVIAHVTTV